MTADDDRVARICQRHEAVVLDDDGRSLARSHQLLCSRRHVSVIDDRLRKWLDSAAPVPGTNVVRVRLRKRAKVDLGTVTTDLEPHARVAPNTLYSGEPHYGGGPSGLPSRPIRNPRAPRPPSDNARPTYAAVLDTGISAHPWFTDRAWFAGCGPRNAERTDSDLDFELDRMAGHGTFVAGLLLRQGPDTFVKPIRLLSSDGICDEADLIASIRALRPAKGGAIDILNVSLGAYTFDDRPSPLLTEALAELSSQTVVVAAAGNRGSSRPFWPAALKSVIAVGALETAGGGAAEFSNRGWWVDACAPGHQLTSSYLWFNGPGGQADADDADLFLGYAQWSGTSFATASVSGAISDTCARKSVSAEVAARLLLDPTRHRYVRDLGLAVLETRRAR